MSKSGEGACGKSLVMSALALESLAQEVACVIKEAVPGVHTVAKYGGTLYTLQPSLKEGQFCGVFVYNHHVQISFSRGAELEDPKGLLAGQGKRRRHINFRSLEELDLEYLEQMLVQGAEYGSHDE